MTIMGSILFFPSQNLYVEVLTPSTSNVTVFGDTVFKEVIKVKRGHMNGP